MAREDLILRVRDMLRDTGSNPTFTDTQIDDALVERRMEFRYEELDPIETLTPTGSEVLGVQSRWMWWDNDVQLVDGEYAELTPDTGDNISARWTFVAEPALPVMIVGFTYDLYGTCGDLVTVSSSIASTAMASDGSKIRVTADGTTVEKSSSSSAGSSGSSSTAQRAAEFYAKARVRQVDLPRTDTW